MAWQGTTCHRPYCSMTSQREVIVVGGGLAGLTAAAVLHESGANVQLLEGAPVLGGRIRTVRDPERVSSRAREGGAPVADLGPTWVWPPYQPVVTRWLQRLGVATFPQYEGGDGVLDGWGPQLQRGPMPVQEGITRIVGGPGALVEALAARLPAGAVRVGATVHAVGPDGPGEAGVAGAARAAGDGAGMTVTLDNGELLRARRVVLATPLRVTAERIAISGLAADVHTTLQAAMLATPTWMSTQAKAVATYATPFWRGRGLSGRLASRAGPLAEVHDHTPHDEAVGALFGFVGVSPGERARDPEALRKAMLAQLVRCLGAEAGAPLALHVQDWAGEPLICGRADLASPPAHPEVGPAVLRAPLLGGRLTLAVSEVSAVSPGLIEGALWAGEAAGKAMLRQS